MLAEREWPSLETHSDQSSLLLFHKIHCGAVSIEKDQGWAVETTPGQYAKKWSILVNTNLSGRLRFLNGLFGGRLRY